MCFERLHHALQALPPVFREKLGVSFAVVWSNDVPCLSYRRSVAACLLLGRERVRGQL